MTLSMRMQYIMLRISLQTHSTICIFTRSHKKMWVSYVKGTPNGTPKISQIGPLIYGITHFHTHVFPRAASILICNQIEVCKEKKKEICTSTATPTYAPAATTPSTILLHIHSHVKGFIKTYEYMLALWWYCSLSEQRKERGKHICALINYNFMIIMLTAYV